MPCRGPVIFPDTPKQFFSVLGIAPRYILLRGTLTIIPHCTSFTCICNTPIAGPSTGIRILDSLTCQLTRPPFNQCAKKSRLIEQKTLSSKKSASPPKKALGDPTTSADKLKILPPSRPINGRSFETRGIVLSYLLRLVFEGRCRRHPNHRIKGHQQTTTFLNITSPTLDPFLRLFCPTQPMIFGVRRVSPIFFLDRLIM